MCLSEAKLKTRSEASRQNIFNSFFCREASLRVFSLASLSHFQRHFRLQKDRKKIFIVLE